MTLFGYTAAIIGFTGITAPGDIFDLVVLGVEEITLGIICATVSTVSGFRVCLAMPSAAGSRAG